MGPSWKKWPHGQSDALRSPLVRAWAWVFVGDGFRILCQGFVFTCVIARLGPESYGLLLSANAVACLLALFTGLGLGSEMVRIGSVSPERLGGAWNQTLRWTVGTGVILAAAGTAICYWGMATKLPLVSLIFLQLSECVFLRVADAAGGILQATHRLRLSAQAQSISAVLRLFAASVFLFLPGTPSTATWILLSFVATILGMVYTVRVSQRHLPKSDAVYQPMKLRNGFDFVVGHFIRSLGPEAQRLLLAASGQVYAAGIYGAAYRVVDTACVPGRSLAYSTMVRFFQEGSRGHHEPRRFAARLMIPVGAMNLLCAVLLFALAPLLSVLSAEKFAQSVPLIQWLCFFPLISSVGVLGSGALVGANRQGLRNGLLLGATLINIALCIHWAPQYSYWGAVRALVVSEILFSIATWVSLFLISAPVSVKRQGPIRLLMVMEATAGGTRRHLLELIDGLLTQYPGQYEIHFIYATGRADAAFFAHLPKLAAKGAILREIKMTRESCPRADFTALFSIWRYARKNRIEIIHGHSAKGGFLARLASAGVPGSRAIYTAHSSPFRLSLVAYCLEWFAGHLLTDAVIATSESEARELIESGTVLASTVHTVYHGIPSTNPQPKRSAA
jgi:O-antigen/teichoic acid export membrane protein